MRAGKSGDFVNAFRDVHVRPRVSIVIPAKNEARNLEVVLPRLPATHEVILVDGRSVDGTVDVARNLLPEIRVVQQTRRGKGNALVCGFAAATGDIVVMFDADGSADPAEIPAFVRALTDGADFAKGSRFCPGGGSHDITRFRRWGNFLLNRGANVLMRTRYTDLCYGYNAFWVDILARLELPAVDVVGASDDQMIWGDGFEIETILNHQVAAAGLRVIEVPSVERSRIFGVSNLNAVTDGFRVLRAILREKRRGRRRRNTATVGREPVITAPVSPAAASSATVSRLVTAPHLDHLATRETA
jgi:glycosyltransferase involved in cell wall biosynthesis